LIYRGLFFWLPESLPLLPLIVTKLKEKAKKI